MNLNKDSSTSKMNLDIISPQKSYLSYSESLEKFTAVVEMINSNKLSKSNAFENRMINFITDIFKGIEENKKDSETIWQRYSAGVDSCAKIYGFCVDFLYSETYRVLGGLTRTENPDLIEPNEEEIDVKFKKSKKKIYGGANTLENDIQSITTSKFDKYDTFDPYFKVISSKFDASTASGLLLNNLLLSGGIEIVLGEDDILTKIENIDFSSKCEIYYHQDINSEKIMNEVISKTLNKFINFSSINETGLQGILDNMENENDLFSDSESEVSIAEDLPDDNTFKDQVSFNKSTIENTSEFSMNTESLHERINSLAERDDYNYFTNGKISSWGGFDHWKKTQTLNHQIEKLPRRKKEYKDMILDPNKQLIKEDVLAPAKKGYPNYYNEASLKKWEETNSHIPEDYGFTLYRLTQLFTRPRTQVKYLKNELEGKNVIIEESKEDKDDEHALFAEEVPNNMMFDYEESLKIASTSKTIDIKKLKDTMWRNLRLENNKENSLHKGKQNNFLSVIDKLPSIMPKQEVENLSIHSCFITLLHLANEHNLQLKSQGNCDFSISQGR